jgi:adenosylhomocysteine nucleosidase
VRVPEPVGIVVALPQECRSLTPQRLRRGDIVALNPHSLIALCGAGPDAAGDAASALIGRGVRRLVSWGCAGALSDTLNAGDVVLAQELAGVDGTRYRIDADWHERMRRRLSPHLPIDAGILVESAAIVATAAAKSSLHGTSGAVATDMESAAVLRVAAARGLPCLSVRAIADTASMALPASVTQSLDEHGMVRLPRLLVHLARQPSDIRALLHLRRCFRAALHSLAKVAELSGPAINP